MADELEVPDDPAALFLALGDEVNPNRPLYTGDVIADVDVPVLQPVPLPVAVVSHPCAIRAGAALLPHLHVAPVVGHSESGRQMWKGNFKYMALDGLGKELGLTNPVIRLDRMTLVPATSLAVERRIACLDRSGVNLLRQRLVHHLTRLVVAVSVFDAEASGVHEEIDLMEEWLDHAVLSGESSEKASEAFHSWLRSADRQGLLASPASAAVVRRDARIEMRSRYS